MQENITYRIIVAVVAIIALFCLSNLNIDTSLSGYAVYAPIGKNAYSTYLPTQQPQPTVTTIRGQYPLNLPDLAVVDIKLEKVKPTQYKIIPIIKNIGPILVNSNPLKGGVRAVRLRIYIDNLRVLDTFPAFYLGPGQSVAVPFEYIIKRQPQGYERSAKKDKKVVVEVTTEHKTLEVQDALVDANVENNRLEKRLTFN